jgi:hypothetical protein
MTALDRLDDEELAQALRASRQLEDAPEAAIQRAIDLWPGRTRVPVRPAGAWARLGAVLRFDSAASDHLALGLRGAAGTELQPKRQWLFTAGEHDVDLRAAPAAVGPLWTLSGQILGPQGAGTATLRSADDAAAATPARTVPWNEWAEFHFDELPPGKYLLRLSGPEGELELPVVPVGL